MWKILLMVLVLVVVWYLALVVVPVLVVVRYLAMAMVLYPTQPFDNIVTTDYGSALEQGQGQGKVSEMSVKR